MRRSRPNLLVSPLENPAAATDLISFLKALPDCRLRRGIRYPQWWMLLVAILAILSNQGSLLGMERFAKRHRVRRRLDRRAYVVDTGQPPQDSSTSCSAPMWPTRRRTRPSGLADRHISAARFTRQPAAESDGGLIVIALAAQPLRTRPGLAFGGP